MRIILINHFPIVGSGSGTYTRNIAAHLVKQGHEVCVIMPENTTHYAGCDGVAIYPVFFTNKEHIQNALPFNFPCFTTHPRSQTSFFDLSDAQIGAYLSGFEREIEKAVHDFKPDIIHAQHIWLLAWLAGKTGVPYVITSHGTDLMGYQKSTRFRSFADEAAAGAKQIISISNDNDYLVRQLFPSCADRLTLMKNGYDTSRFYPECVTSDEILKSYGFHPLKYLVLFSGKHVYFKGIDVLIEAARIYEGEHPGKIVTAIAGEGELTGQLKKQASDCKLRNVHFLGHIEYSQLRALYSMADVTVVPSRREPFGLVAVEALACGCPVIATNQGGLPDIVNDKVGALVDVDDPVALAAAVQAEIFRSDRKDRSRFAAQYAIDNFSQDPLVETLVKMYENVLPQTGKAY
jgi:glycosyltransferase involved in cell wall biosynthesis